MTTTDILHEAVGTQNKVISKSLEQQEIMLDMISRLTQLVTEFSDIVCALEKRISRLEDNGPLAQVVRASGS